MPARSGSGPPSADRSARTSVPGAQVLADGQRGPPRAAGACRRPSPPGHGAAGACPGRSAGGQAQPWPRGLLVQWNQEADSVVARRDGDCQDGGAPHSRARPGQERHVVQRAASSWPSSRLCSAAPPRAAGPSWRSLVDGSGFPCCCFHRQRATERTASERSSSSPCSTGAAARRRRLRPRTRGHWPCSIPAAHRPRPGSSSPPRRGQAAGAPQRSHLVGVAHARVVSSSAVSFTRSSRP